MSHFHPIRFGKLIFLESGHCPFHSNRPQFVSHEIGVTRLNPSFSEWQFVNVLPEFPHKFFKFRVEPLESDASWNFCHIAPITFFQKIGLSGWVGSSRILSLEPKLPVTPSTQSNLFPNLICFFYVETHKVSTSIRGGFHTTQNISWTGSFRTFIVHGWRTAPDRVRKRSKFGRK